MAHRRGTFRRGISQSQRRKKLWGSFNVFATDSAGQGSLTQLIMNFDPPTIPVGAAAGTSSFAAFQFEASKTFGKIDAESTLMRIRGSLNQDKNSVDSATGEFNTFAFGMGVMESTAVAGAALPNPATRSGADWDGWMFYRSINTSILDANASIIDVKAMRKIQSGYSFFMIYGQEYNSRLDAVSTVAVTGLAQMSGRGLFLLP